MSFKNRMIFKSFVFLLMGTSAQAALVRNLDDRYVIEVPVSKQGLTRIAVTGDRILNVFGVVGEYVLEADEGQGQIFIRPLCVGALKPISLTLTTEGGRTQDLCLLPKDKTPEALILQDNEKMSAEGTKEKHANAHVTREDIEELIHASQSGRIPLGYKSIPLDLKTLRSTHPLVREVKGSKLRCLTYDIKNNTNAPLILTEEEFAMERDTIAILISTKTLSPGEGTAAYVVTRTRQ